MKGTIIDAHIEGDTFYVTKHTKYGTFKGKVTLCDEDKDVKSEIDGYSFAERKCDLQALKVKADFFKQRAIGVQHAYKVMKHSGIDLNDPIAQKLKRQVKVAWDNYNYHLEVYKINKENYYPNIERLLNYRRMIRKTNE